MFEFTPYTTNFRGIKKMKNKTNKKKVSHYISSF